MLRAFPFALRAHIKNLKRKKGKKKKVPAKGQGYEVGKFFDKKILPDRRTRNSIIFKNYWGNKKRYNLKDLRGKIILSKPVGLELACLISRPNFAFIFFYLSKEKYFYVLFA